ncbi:MAG TPA: hypothetical protein VJZ91_11310 [Blastocatellia bacterium]|nr:hypothetical protein [Blastocatellia bacterium]
MSAKLTIFFFILICFEIGALLIILPWVQRPSWSENYLLVLAADHLHWPQLAMAMKSSYMRGAVTGLGVVNILIGLWEAANFTRTTRTFQQRWQSHESDPQATDAARLPDHRPADAAAAEPPAGTAGID